MPAAARGEAALAPPPAPANALIALTTHILLTLWDILRLCISLIRSGVHRKAYPVPPGISRQNGAYPVLPRTFAARGKGRPGIRRFPDRADDQRSAVSTNVRAGPRQNPLRLTNVQ